MRRVAIAAPSAPAADAGAHAADSGGNAVDAAIAATITAVISEPGIIGPGAGGFITVCPPHGSPVVVDGYAAMPGRGAAVAPSGFGDRIYMEYGGGMETLIGPASVAVPGLWAGLGEASRRFGSLPWAKLLEFAIDTARRGFPLSAVSEAYLAYSHEPIYDREPDSFAALHHDDGTRAADGDVIRIEGLADSLETIAAEGPDTFYTGTIGSRLVAMMDERGGWVTAVDLVDYEAVVREPVHIEVGEWEIFTNPPPAIGGSVLAAMMLLIQASGFSDWSPAGVRAVAEVQRSVLAYRARELDGAEDPGAAAAHLLEQARFGDHRRLTDSASTVHVSAVDTAALGCAITSSAGYGSGVMVPGTGLWLNNSLGEVELFPRGMASFAPGDRLPSNMAPTVARSEDGSVLAVGSPGASRITTALAQVLMNFIAMGMSVSESVAHARLHIEEFEGRPTIAHEPGLPVEAFGDYAVRRFPDISMYFGGVGFAMYDPAAGLFEVTDPRRSGATAVGGL